jgi:hypothetical protein
MSKASVPSLPVQDQQVPPFSEDVPFPEAHLNFIDGTEITLRPRHMSHSVTGVHYTLEVFHPEDGRAEINLTFAAHGGQTDKRKRYVEIEAEYGQPLKFSGERHNFQFNGGHPAFYPECSYKLAGVTPNGGYIVELESLRKFRLYHFKQSE